MGPLGLIGEGVTLDEMKELTSEVHCAVGTPGVRSYIHIAAFKYSDYANSPISFTVSQRGGSYRVSIKLNSVSPAAVDIAYLNYIRITGTGSMYYTIDDTTATLNLYVYKSEKYDSVSISELTLPKYMTTKVDITWSDIALDALPTGNVGVKEKPLNTDYSRTAISPVKLTDEDLNDYNTADVLGYYYAGGGNTVANKPEGIDNNFGLEISRSADGNVTQTIHDHRKRIFFRVWVGSNKAWNIWREITTYTKDEIDSKVDIKIGGRNLLMESSLVTQKSHDSLVVSSASNISKSLVEGKYTVISKANVTTSRGSYNKKVYPNENFRVGLPITNSILVYIASDVSLSNTSEIFLRFNKSGSGHSDIARINLSGLDTNTWLNLSATSLIPNQDNNFDNIKGFIAIGMDDICDIYVKNWKVELGNKATDWTPALEDLALVDHNHDEVYRKISDSYTKAEVNDLVNESLDSNFAWAYSASGSVMFMTSPASGNLLDVYNGLGKDIGKIVDGEVDSSYTSYYTTTYIPVHSSVKVILYGDSGLDDDRTVGFYFYDSNKVFMEDESLSYVFYNGRNCITPPAGASYMKVSMFNTYWDRTDMRYEDYPNPPYTGIAKDGKAGSLNYEDYRWYKTSENRLKTDQIIIAGERSSAGVRQQTQSEFNASIKSSISTLNTDLAQRMYTWDSTYVKRAVIQVPAGKSAVVYTDYGMYRILSLSTTIVITDMVKPSTELAVYSIDQTERKIQFNDKGTGNIRITVISAYPITAWRYTS